MNMEIKNEADNSYTKFLLNKQFVIQLIIIYSVPVKLSIDCNCKLDYMFNYNIENIVLFMFLLHRTMYCRTKSLP